MPTERTTRSTFKLGTISLLMALTSIAVGGCGTDTNADPTPVQTFKITPAANRTATLAAPTVAPGTGPSPTEASPTGSPIVIAGINSKFDLADLRLPEGNVTVEFDNRDSGVVHNIHFFRVSGDDRESVAETELEVGPIEQTLTFDVESGEYIYQCDTHPTTMEGILTVE